MIKKILLEEKQLKPLYEDASKLQFGTIFTDYMFVMDYNPELKWHNATIKPYQPLILDPAALVFHYGQEVFEGQKAYKTSDDQILLFRPWENAKRMNNSLQRLCMPHLPEDIYVKAMSELVGLERRWVPKEIGASLYIRPTVIATEPKIGMKSSDNYLFFIILTPARALYKKESGVNLWASDKYVRAVAGGTGEVKTGANYAGSLLAAQEAKKYGCDQVLWLDAKEHKYIEEVGTSNIFFVMNGTLVTPKLSGSILNGITRKSVIELAHDMGIKVEERSVTIQEVIQGIENGNIQEIFGSGTAAAISPVGKIYFKDQIYCLKNGTGPITKGIYDELTGIQYGRISDKHGWILKI